MIIMVIRIVLVLLDYVQSRPVAMGNSSEIEVLAGTSLKNGGIFQPCLITKDFTMDKLRQFPQIGCRTLNSAGFLSLRDDSPQEEEDEQQQSGQVAVFFFCGWLAGRCFSLAVHCSVVLFRLITLWWTNIAMENGHL